MKNENNPTEKPRILDLVRSKRPSGLDEFAQACLNANEGNRVLVIYSGGTIGSKPKDPDPDSPQVVTTWEDLIDHTPEVWRLGFPVDCVPFATPLDSCNVGPAEWTLMAEVIKKYYDSYRGFVVLHGTDTMSNTASALSFMLQGLKKPVILTGAQVSAMVDVCNDATPNFLTALRLANPVVTGIPVVSEVCVYFGGRLLRGNRTIKLNTASLQPFDTPNHPRLGAIGQKYVIYVDLLQTWQVDFEARTKMDPRVIPVDIGPGIQDTKLIEQILKLPDLKGVILRAYGTGDLPTKTEFLDVLRDARERGIVAAVVSQCPEGPVELGIYDTSAKLVEAGLVAGYDITPQAAHCKLMYLLGRADDLSHDEIEQLFQQNLAGEQSRSVWLTRFEGKGHAKASGETLPNEASVFRLRGRPVQGQFQNPQVRIASLRLRRARFTRAGENELRLRIYCNWEPGQSLDGPFVTARRAVGPSEGLAIFDVTNLVRPIARSGQTISFMVAIASPGGEVSWESAELAIVTAETAQ